MVALYTNCSDNTILVRMSILGYIIKFANPTVLYTELPIGISDLEILQIFYLF